MVLPAKTLSLLAALALAACAPSANTGRSAVADGVKFEYGLTPIATATAAHTYRLSLTLSDAQTGARIPDATVALDLFGPGYPGGTTVSLEPASLSQGAGYGADVRLPQAANYRLTFQANRKAPAPSAVAIFTTDRPAAG
jgi:hypothetical protein